MGDDVTVELTHLDEFFLQIETPARPMHWTVVVNLDPVESLRGSVTQAPETAKRLDALISRVRARLEDYPQFSYGVAPHLYRKPRLRRYDMSTVMTCLSSVVVGGEHEYLQFLSGLMTRPLTRDRPLWRAILIEQQRPNALRLAILGHHCMSDGVASMGIAALFVDAPGAELRQFDRYLNSERYDGPQLSVRRWLTASRTMLANWVAASGSRRLPRLTTQSRRAFASLDISTTDLRRASANCGAGTTEFLVAAISATVADLTNTVNAPHRRATTLRAFMPMTMDKDLRHTGNAASMVLINADMADTDFSNRVRAASTQLAALSDTNAAAALPTLSRLTRRLPWRIRRSAGRATLRLLAPDVHIGVSPGYVKLDSICDNQVDGFQIYSPLLGNALSFTCLVLGRTVSIGIVWDPEAYDDKIGAAAAHRVTEIIDQYATGLP